jgi:hypothetical protein
MRRRIASQCGSRIVTPRSMQSGAEGGMRKAGKLRIGNRLIFKHIFQTVMEQFHRCQMYLLDGLAAEIFRSRNFVEKRTQFV